MSSNFVTDLSQEPCWLSPTVQLWAFGHTHYSCNFRDEDTGKLTVANQRGYAGLGAGRKKVGVKTKVVEAGEEGWEVVGQKLSEGKHSRAIDRPTPSEVVDNEEEQIDAKKPKASLLHRMTRRLHS